MKNLIYLKLFLILFLISSSNIYSQSPNGFDCGFTDFPPTLVLLFHQRDIQNSNKELKKPDPIKNQIRLF